MRDIYQQAADELYMKSCKMAARRIERLCNLCWDRLQEDEELLNRIVGSRTKELDAPSEVIFLLACYIKYEEPSQIETSRAVTVAFLVNGVYT